MMRLLLLFPGFHAGRKLIGLLLHASEVLGHVLHANFLEALASRHDAVVEGDVRMPMVQFVNFKSLGTLLGYVQAFAFAIRSEEDVVVHVSIYGLREYPVERDRGGTVDELARACIFEPVVSGFDRVHIHHAISANHDCSVNRTGAV